MSGTTSAMTLLLPSIGGYNTPLGEVLGADSSATTYLLNCDPENPEYLCDNDVTLTIGPWADQTLAPGAIETGEMGLRVSGEDGGKTWDYSLHCEMSRSVAQQCIRVVTDGERTLTSTYTGETQLQEVFGPTFDYAFPTITSGLEKLSESEINAPTAETRLTPTTSPSLEETGSSTTSADEPEDNNGVASSLPSTLGVMFAAELASSIVLWEM